MTCKLASRQNFGVQMRLQIGKTMVVYPHKLGLWSYIYIYIFLDYSIYLFAFNILYPKLHLQVEESKLVVLV